MAIEKFDREVLKGIRTLISGALAPIEKELGIQIQMKGGSFTETDYSFKITCCVKGETGEFETPERTAFKQEAHKFGMSPDDLGKEFPSPDGVIYKIIGLKPRSRKYPIVCERTTTGEKFKFSPMYIKHFIQ